MIYPKNLQDITNCFEIDDEHKESKNHLFRGHSKYYPYTQSTLTRFKKDHSKNFSKQDYLNLINKYKHLFPQNLNDQEYLILLRHYGLPTPILDYTTDYKIATWFATSKHDDKTGYLYDTGSNYYQISLIENNQIKKQSTINLEEPIISSSRHFNQKSKYIISQNLITNEYNYDKINYYQGEYNHEFYYSCISLKENYTKDDLLWKDIDNCEEQRYSNIPILTIPKESKQQILKDLKEQYNIDHDYIYKETNPKLNQSEIEQLITTMTEDMKTNL